MSATGSPEPLAADRVAALTDFARACKAAARVVNLYPSTHPAIPLALSRVSEASRRVRGNASVMVTVMPNTLMLDGKAPEKTDSAIDELAVLLHSHQVGEFTMLGDPTPESWLGLLTVLGRPPEEVRASGGLARAWMAVGGGPIDIRQIDYSEVLRERGAGLGTRWDRIMANYLEGELSDLDDHALQALFDIAGDQERFKDFTEKLVSAASEGRHRGLKDVVLRVLQALADFVARTYPDQLDRILHQIVGVVPRLSADLVVSLMTTGVPREEGDAPPGIDLTGEIRARLTDQSIAEFVARSVSQDRGASERLVQAFQTLLPEQAQREAVLELAEAEVAKLPISRQGDFAEMWRQTSEMLATYSDAAYVSQEYGRELSTARTHAIEVDRVSDDPPERINQWLATVASAEVRKLDSQVLLDLLQIETRAPAWRAVLDSAIALIEQLVLVGDMTLAVRLLDSLVDAAQTGRPFVETAREGLERLRQGPLMRHVVLLVRQVENDDDVQLISSFCRTLGPAVIGPLAEALAVEQAGGTVRRLREILLSFGAAGRAYAVELRASANPAVRRTAIDLLRAFGGADALPDLAELLNDSEPAVMREALRAIVQIGTDEAYETLGKALKSGTGRTREAIMQVLISSRDERAAPLFIYILEHSDYRGPLEAVYLSAVDALGKIGGDPDSVNALKKVLYRGEWWAPFRTKRLRTAAAKALRASGTTVAQEALEEVATNAARGIRRIARAALATPIARTPIRRAT